MTFYGSRLIEVKGEILDRCLELGYFRQGQSVFTADEYYDYLLDMHFTCFWLRTRIKEMRDITKHKIWKQNRRFSVEISQYTITEEVASLFEVYRENVDFETSSSIVSYLHSGFPQALFDTKLVTVRDGDLLIAAGYFDEGSKSIMGLMNFYHPAYRKFSLGKYLMLCKIDYALQKGMNHYYTGYIALENTKFDYKLFPDPAAVDVFLPNSGGIWVPFESLGKQGLLKEMYPRFMRVY